METYEKRGYLNSDFKLFHLTDTKKQDFEPHYHDFDKIIIFIKGRVQYMVEGRLYRLCPYDIVLVNHSELHRPIIDPAVPYERIIVYLSPGFITSYKTEDYDLGACFCTAREQRSSVLRIHALKKSSLLSAITALEHALSHGGYAGELYCQVLFLEFMIQLNRASLGKHLEYLNTGSGNEKIAAIMDYINGHLTEELSIDCLASAFYLNKYYLMHLFKEETGYTVGAYITQKRLLLARDLLMTGKTAMSVCLDCGFKNYSTFFRAYKKHLGESPLKTRQRD